MPIRGRTAAAVFAALASTAAPAAADVVLDWNEIMVATVSGQNPFAQARVAAITQLAVFEAVNAVTGDHRPYLGTLQAPAGASVEAAAVAAAHKVLRFYLPASGSSLDAARATSLAAIPDGDAKAAGIQLGEAAADAMIALRANDGAAPPQFHVPAAADPGVWQLTPGCPPAGGILLHWRHLTPFGLESSAQFRSGPPPRLGGRRYAKDYEEVLAVGGADSAERPVDRADVARFYNVVLAVGTWNPVVRQAAAARGLSLSDSARALALVNMAISDALVTVMETKYHYNFWRPQTAIHAGAADGNPKTDPDPGFTPFVPAPCFPSYPSAHASASYAAMVVASRLLGRDGHAITLSHPVIPDVVLHYASLEAIVRDIDDARVFGGIHFRFEQVAGARQGRRVGRFVYRHHLTRLYEADEGDADDGKEEEERDDTEGGAAVPGLLR